MESEGITLALGFANEDLKGSVERLKASYDDFITNSADVLLDRVRETVDTYKEFKLEVGDTVLIDSAKESLSKIGETLLKDVNPQILGAQEAVRGLKIQLDNLGSTSVEGSAAFNVEEQKKVNDIEALRLDILRLQKREKEGDETATQRIKITQKI